MSNDEFPTAWAAARCALTDDYLTDPELSREAQYTMPDEARLVLAKLPPGDWRAVCSEDAAAADEHQLLLSALDGPREVLVSWDGCGSLERMQVPGYAYVVAWGGDEYAVGSELTSFLVCV